MLCCAQLLSHVRLFATPWTVCSPPGSSVHGDSPGKNTGVGCRALLQYKAAKFHAIQYKIKPKKQNFHTYRELAEICSSNVFVFYLSFEVAHIMLQIEYVCVCMCVCREIQRGQNCKKKRATDRKTHRHIKGETEILILIGDRVFHI